MSEREPDYRTLLFAGDETEDGQPLPMTVEVLRERAGKWPISPNTPDNVASILRRSRQMFVEGFFTYENFADAATRSLQAVEAALRVRLQATTSTRLATLIKRARAESLVDEDTQEILNIGRKLRNIEVHATEQAVCTPAHAANIIRTSHVLTAELFPPQ